MIKESKISVTHYSKMENGQNRIFIDDLILNHYDHQGNNRLYHCEYLKNEVEKMLAHYKKQLILEKNREKRKRIEY